MSGVGTAHQLEPASPLALWFGWLAGPVAALLLEVIGLPLVDQACTSSSKLSLHLVSLGALLFAVAGTAVAWRSWRRAGRRWPDDSGGAVARSRFLGALGVVSGALFIAVVIAEWLAVLVLSPCQ